MVPMQVSRMRHFGRLGRRWVLLIFSFVCAQEVVTMLTGNSFESIVACRDFTESHMPEASWTLDDCLNVWEAYRDTLEVRYHVRPPHVDFWRETADDLRRAGSPCLLTSMNSSDGVGSVTIRHLSNWIMAKEMGCDWITPEWGTKALKMNNYNKTSDVVYCHSHASLADRDNFTLNEFIKSRRCMVVNWLQYFNFGIPSTNIPEETTVKTVEDVAINNATFLENVRVEIEREGIAGLPWDNLVITMPRSLPSAHLAAVGSWDPRKNQIVREVLQEARRNFHQHPRPWYDENLQCAFDTNRLNFAVHIRLGDRSSSPESRAQHFRLLEEFMTALTDVMTEAGMQPPLFHVFSETEDPCPSPETGVFDEFPTWQVKLDQVPPCLTAEAPKECPLRGVQRGCFPERSGIFRLQDKPIVLHVSTDVTNALSCMIHSDGVVMGCSTFGQIAGLLTKGISFFSMGCKGDITPVQYKTIPPIAVAERGHLWVPLSGSWHDPILKNIHILRRALDTVMANRE